MFHPRTCIVSLALALSSTWSALAASSSPQPPDTYLNLAPGVVARLAHGSVVQKLKPVMLDLDGSGSALTHQVILSTGRADTELPALPLGGLAAPGSSAGQQAVMIRGSHGVFAISRSGQLTTHVEGRRTVFVNRGGEVLVGAGPSVRRLQPGTMQVMMGSSTVDIRALAAAPELEPGPRVWLTYGDGTTRLTDVRWKPVDGAVRYVIRLVEVSTGRAVWQTSSVEHALAEGPALGAGVYQLTMASVDVDGIEGPSSSGEALRVVQVRIPAGARVLSDGLVLLPPGESVDLTRAEGLEMSYGQTQVWFSAPRDLSPTRGERETVIRLRAPGSEHSTGFRLARRTDSAEVTVGPAGATWPRDNVRIAVDVDDPGAHSAGTCTPPQIEVTVDGEPAEVRWTTVGGQIQGVLRARPGLSASVVRVRVTDEHGMVLGRGFLEVARETRKGAEEWEGTRVLMTGTSARRSDGRD